MKKIALLIIFLILPQASFGLTEIEVWQKGDATQIKQAINKGLLTKRYGDKFTPLILVARQNPNLDAIKEILKLSSRLEDTDSYGYTALMHAGMHNKPEIVEELIKAGAKINYKTSEDYTAFILAVANSPYPEVIKVFLKHGANANEKAKFGCTALMIGAMSNDLPIILELIKAGADVNAVSDDKATSLMYAAINNPNPEVIKELVMAGAKIDEVDGEGNTALMLAAENNAAVGTMLINLGANTKLRNKEHKSALDYARASHNMKLVSELLKANKKD